MLLLRGFEEPMLFAGPMCAQSVVTNLKKKTTFFKKNHEKSGNGKERVSFSGLPFSSKQTNAAAMMIMEMNGYKT